MHNREQRELVVGIFMNFPEMKLFLKRDRLQMCHSYSVFFSIFIYCSKNVFGSSLMEAHYK